MNKKIIIGQYDPNTNELIATFKTYREAAEAVGSNVGNIWRAVQGEYKTSKGYAWKEYIPTEPTKQED